MQRKRLSLQSDRFILQSVKSWVKVSAFGKGLRVSQRGLTGNGRGQETGDASDIQELLTREERGIVGEETYCARVRGEELERRRTDTDMHARYRHTEFLSTNRHEACRDSCCLLTWKLLRVREAAVSGVAAAEQVTKRPSVSTGKTWPTPLFVPSTVPRDGQLVSCRVKEEHGATDVPSQWSDQGGHWPGNHFSHARGV